MEIKTTDSEVVAEEEEEAVVVEGSVFKTIKGEELAEDFRELSRESIQSKIIKEL